MAINFNDLCIHKNPMTECSVCKKQYKEINQKTEIDGTSYYNKYQVIELIWDAGYGEGFCLGNTIKYIARAKKKNSQIVDYEKALWYLNYYVNRTKQNAKN